MTEFKPATPEIVPGSAPPALHPMHGPAPVEGTPPPGAPHVPHYGVPKRIITSRTTVGVPSTSPPPHLTPEKPAALPQAKKEYAWQKKRELGQRF